MQEVITGILFFGALFFMGRMLWRQYKAEDGCGEGCHGCDIAEFSKPKLPDHLAKKEG
jgi:hypothetical protein